MDNPERNADPATSDPALVLESFRNANQALERKLAERNQQAIVDQKTIAQLTHDLSIYEAAQKGKSSEHALAKALRELKESRLVLTHMLKIANVGYAVWD
jgi:hypothetical protein